MSPDSHYPHASEDAEHEQGQVTPAKTNGMKNVANHFLFLLL
jgi:hypothetical protein